MAQLKHFNRTDDPSAMLEAIRSDGAIIIDDAVEAGNLERIVRELKPYVEATNDGHDEFSGHQTTRTGGLVIRSPACRELIQDDTILTLCNRFLGDYCERYQLHLTQVIRIKPGESAQAIHRDRWAWGVHLAHVEPQLNTIWALTEFSEENGATRVVPGSGDWPDERSAHASEITQASMRAGSVLVYTGSVFHGGGENRSQADRWGLNITYSLGWLRQEENQYLSTPPELARELEPKLQELIGYSMGQYALGYYTPPGKPGESPDLVPPQHALGRGDEGGGLGSLDDLTAIVEKAGQQDSQDSPLA